MPQVGRRSFARSTAPFIEELLLTLGIHRSYSFVVVGPRYSSLFVRVAFYFGVCCVALLRTEIGIHGHEEKKEEEWMITSK